MNAYTISDFRASIRNGAYTSTGCYPLYFVTSDGEALSFEAAKSERRQILEAIRDRSNCGWRVIGVEVNWENADLYCAHTGKRIESAYAED
jgi:hypothetical protein